MDNSYFCPAWLVPPAADPAKAPLQYSTFDIKMSHVLPFKDKDGKEGAPMVWKAKDVKLVVPMLATSIDSDKVKHWRAHETLDVMKLERGLLWGAWVFHFLRCGV